METVVVTPRYCDKRDPLFRRFHMEGVRSYGRDWSKWRPVYVGIHTNMRTTSSREMYPAEMVAAIEAIIAGRT